MRHALAQQNKVQLDSIKRLHRQRGGGKTAKQCCQCHHISRLCSERKEKAAADSLVFCLKLWPALYMLQKEEENALWRIPVLIAIKGSLLLNSHYGVRKMVWAIRGSGQWHGHYPLAFPLLSQSLSSASPGPLALPSALEDLSGAFWVPQEEVGQVLTAEQGATNKPPEARARVQPPYQPAQLWYGISVQGPWLLLKGLCDCMRWT